MADPTNRPVWRACIAAMVVSVPLFAAGAVAPIVALPAPPAVATPVPVVHAGPPAAERSAVPVGLQIPAIGLAEPSVVDLGIDGAGRLEAPEDFARVGWFTDGPLPGAVGPAVMVGHVDSRAGPAVFYRLRELEAGDEIVVPRSDGGRSRFAVDRIEQYPKDSFPALQVYGATPGPELRLITCGGTFDRSVRHYVDNIVVYASAV